MCDDQKLCSPDQVEISSSTERDKRRFEDQFARLRKVARSRACGSTWYDDQKKKALWEEDFFGGSTSDYNVAQAVVDEFRKEGWQCKVVYVMLGNYSIEFYNPKMKPSWWWRVF